MSILHELVKKQAKATTNPGENLFIVMCRAWLLMLAVSVMYLPPLATAAAAGQQTNSTASLFVLPAQLAAILQSDEQIQRSELPAVRLPQPAGGWFQCGYSCMLNFNSSVRTGPATPGALEVDVQFKPLANITSEMMVWLFNNLAKPVAWRNGSTITLTPMYQFFHPIDHVVHRSSTPGVRVGTNLTWCEIPLTGCRHQPLSSDEPWLCPASRSGLVRSSPASTWQRLMHTNVTMTVTVFNSSLIEFVVRRRNLLFGGSGTRVVATTRHTWSDGPSGLQLRSQQWLGLMAAGSSTTTFDRSPLAAAANQVIGATYIGGAVLTTNVPPGNLTAAGYMAVLHYLQEYGGLRRWLPRVFAARQSVVPSWAGTLKPLGLEHLFGLDGGGSGSSSDLP